jgi:hypothetical protein
VRVLDLLYEQYPNHTVVFTRLWQLDQGLFLSYFDRLYSASEMSINAIVDIAQAVHVRPCPIPSLPSHGADHLLGPFCVYRVSKLYSLRDESNFR